MLQVIEPMESLPFEPYVLQRSMHVAVEPTDDEHTATLGDANVKAELGPKPARQVPVLRRCIQRVS